MQIAIDLPNDFVTFQSATDIQQEVRNAYALWLYQKQRVTLAKAAELAKINLYDNPVDGDQVRLLFRVTNGILLKPYGPINPWAQEIASLLCMTPNKTTTQTQTQTQIFCWLLNNEEEVNPVS